MNWNLLVTGNVLVERAGSSSGWQVCGMCWNLVSRWGLS